MFAIRGSAAGSWQGTDLRAISVARNTSGFSVATHSTIRMRSKLWATLARDAIRFIEKYQKKDTGEIFHELSQSAGLINWFKDYPYAYGHTDVSAMYLVAFRNLYRASGDIDFVRSSWDSIKAAYRYLVTRVDPSDGLVTIPAGGWGGDETVSQQVAKDVYLESVWVAGAEALKGLANLVGDRELAGDAHGRAEKARASLAAKIWNTRRDFFFYGFNGKGELLTQELSQPNWGTWMGVFDEEKSDLALDNMAHARWEADWGTRSVSSGDPLYIGDSYGHGSVWPLGTGIQALAFYSHHRPLAAFPLWHTLVEQSFLNSLGHVPEVSRATFIASSTSACLSRSGPRASSLRRYCVAYSAWSPTRTALSSTGRRTCRPVGPVSRSRICKSGAPRWPSK